jgi:3-oxoacyl-[acyl-carrier protein] reductase
VDLGLNGKGALVTGASSGLGFAAAETLAREGADVVINSRTLARLEDAARRIERSTGRKPGIAVGDLSEPATIRSVVETARKALPAGRVDILVSNTGGPKAGLFLEHAEEAWPETADALLHSAISLTRELLPAMTERGWGRLIYITSIAALQPVDDLILSNTYRAGLTGFCKTLSNTYAKYGVTANTVCPGYTATERLNELAASRAAKSGQSAEEVLKGLGSMCPVGRVGRPEELAALIAFLSSEHAAYITGASIPVDGGSRRSLI